MQLSYIIFINDYSNLYITISLFMYKSKSILGIFFIYKIALVNTIKYESHGFYLAIISSAMYIK